MLFFRLFDFVPAFAVCHSQAVSEDAAVGPAVLASEQGAGCMAPSPAALPFCGTQGGEAQVEEVLTEAIWDRVRFGSR